MLETHGRVLPCGSNTCPKHMHELCYRNLCKRYLLPFLPAGENIACTKKCYEKIKRQIKDRAAEVDQNNNLPWERDGKLGVEDYNNSLQVLMDWWTTPGQYAKYRGKNNKGVKKISICGFLATKMSAVSRCVRTPNMVKCKVMHIENSWKKAHDWANATGQGVKENDGMESFEEGCLFYCKHYFTLYDVMVERCSATPLASSDSLYFPDVESESSVSSEVSSGNDFEETRPSKKARRKIKKKITITPLKENPFELLDKETLDILDGGNEIEEKKLDEVKRHNLVMEKEANVREKKEAHSLKMQMMKDFLYLKKENLCTQTIINMFPEMEQFDSI